MQVFLATRFTQEQAVGCIRALNLEQRVEGFGPEA
jgi:hypothetical protein